MEKKLTCIICPLGCELTVDIEGKNVLSVNGNTCPRGKKYATDECTNPMRTVTSTVRCADGGVVAVKTDSAIPKKDMSECMKIINKSVAHLPISVGDIIIKDVFGANVVATQNKE